MFTPGNLLFFTPFYFNNNNEPKRKFFVVLHNENNKFVMASLPTSKDHIPDDLKKHGCICCEQMQIICYCIKKHVVITNTGFSFDKDTYMYGNELGDYDIELFNTKYTTSEIEVKGRLNDAEFHSIKTCFANSPNVKRKYKRMLAVNVVKK
jgi:hypothetical protein